MRVQHSHLFLPPRLEEFEKELEEFALAAPFMCVIAPSFVCNHDSILVIAGSVLEQTYSWKMCVDLLRSHK